MALQAFIARLPQLSTLRGKQSKEEHKVPPLAIDEVALVKALTELDRLVGLTAIKADLVKKITLLYMDGEKGFEGHPLHIVLMGTPGTGKTTVAMLLGRIWVALGLIRAPPPTKETRDNATDQVTSHPAYRRLKNELADAKADLSNITDQKDLAVTYICKVQTGLRKRKRQHDEALSMLNNKRARLVEVKADTLPIDLAISVIRESSIEFNYILKVTDEEVGVAEASERKGFLSFTLPPPPKKPVFKVFKRQDLIGQYLGESALKTRAALESCIPGCCLIDEAYSLYNPGFSSGDAYGLEALTVINEYMSLYPNNLLIIFAGYKDQLANTIFTAQEGLRSRCGFFYEIEPYTGKELATIFKLQVGTPLTPEQDALVTPFFETHKALFPAYGRDIQRFLLGLKMNHSERRSAAFLEGKEAGPLITAASLAEAAKEMGALLAVTAPSKPPEGFYN
ncbi:ATPase [uncultured virus]|nr:ATPase [uncultured virus]